MSTTWKTVFYPITILLVLALSGFVIYEMRQVVTVLIISFIISYLLSPIADRIESRGLNRSLAIAIIFVVIGIILVGFTLIILPGLVQQLEKVQQAFESGEAELMMGQFEAHILSFIPENFHKQLNIQGEIADILGNASQQIVQMIIKMISSVYYFLILPIAVFFFMRDGQRIKKSFIRNIPNRFFETALNVIHKIDQQLGDYLRGVMIDASIIGTLATIALAIVGSPYALLIGIFTGLANMIPYVGPVVGMITAILVNFFATGHFDLLLPIIVALLIVQLLDNVLVQPMVIASSVSLHPLTIILVIIVGGQFFGLLGMFLAVPVAGTIKVTGSELARGFKDYI
jgi:predicted PurR-regulated permease PerM